MKITALLMGVIGAILVASSALAQVPQLESIALDAEGCNVDVVWTDGVDAFATRIETSVNGVARDPVDLDDIVGDQSGIVDSFTVASGSNVATVLFDGEEELDDDLLNVTCPAPTATPTATASPTATATATPTATTVPTAVADDASLTIDVEVLGLDETNFEYELTPGQSASLDDTDPPVVRSNLALITHIIEQRSLSGWRLVNVTCTSDQADADIDIERDLTVGFDVEVSVTLRSGEDVTCVFTNERVISTSETATATAVPSTPVPASTPVVLRETNTLVRETIREVPPSVAPAPVAPLLPVPPVIPSSTNRITAPNTGSGGLLGVGAIGDEGSSVKYCSGRWYWSQCWYW